MSIKPRTIPIALQVRRYLNQRMSLSPDDLKQLAADEKGYQGECLFDKIIAESAVSTYFQLCDLLLEWNHTTFQIDSLLISPHKIYLFDVKNYEGEFYIDGTRWYRASGNEIKNPITQLERSESLLRPLIQSLGLSLPIEAKVVFVNPEFTLFQANRNLPIILPTQINSYMKKLTPYSMNSDSPLFEAAKKLALLHIEDSPFNKLRIPEYSYERLKKGTGCRRCGSLSVHLCGRFLSCDRCGEIEDLDAGIIRIVYEFKLLFPGRLITVSAINEFSGLNMNRERLQRILRNHFKMVGKGKTAYYAAF